MNYEANSTRLDEDGVDAVGLPAVVLAWPVAAVPVRHGVQVPAVQKHVPVVQRGTVLYS